MEKLMHLIRIELSGMFTKNILDDVIEKIERIIAKERGRCCDEEGIGAV